MIALRSCFNFFGTYLPPSSGEKEGNNLSPPRCEEGPGEGSYFVLRQLLNKWSACCLLLIACLSCAHYSTSATGSGGIRSVAVPLLDNESLEAGIHQALTDSLIRGFVSDGALRVVEEDRADAVLQGAVLEIKEEPFTYGQTNAEQYQISVFVKMVFYDARQKQTLWEMDRMRGYGIYDATRQRDLARAEGIGDALQMLAKDVVDRTQVGGW